MKRSFQQGPGMQQGYGQQFYPQGGYPMYPPMGMPMYGGMMQQPMGGRQPRDGTTPLSTVSDILCETGSNKVCSFFNTEKGCAKGKTCNFLHEPIRKKPRQCTFFTASGGCKKGLNLDSREMYNLCCIR